MAFGRKKEKESQNISSDARAGTQLDSIWRILRTMKAEIADLQRREGNDRRDINRIERKLDREREADSVGPQIDKPGTTDVDLTGLPGWRT